jgi:glycine cleavage system protein P-like pyridoxal-binding family
MATVFGSGPANAIIGVGKEAKPYEFEPIVFEENGSTTQKKFKSAYMSPSFGYVAILHATYEQSMR